MSVSFVIPSFNHAAWLPHAVKSCQDQTHKDIEIVIVDDCSTDTTKEYLDWLSKQGDERIKIICNQKNMGRSYCRNIGDKEAKYGIIAVLDSDDLAIADRAKWTIKKMKNCQVCYGSAITMNAIGISTGEIQAGPINIKECLNPMTNWKENLEKGVIDLRENRIVHSSMAYLKEIAIKYPYADGDISDLGIDDWEMQIRMMKDGVKFDFIPDVVCAYRMHGAGISQTRDPLKVMEAKAKILEGAKCL